MWWLVALPLVAGASWFTASVASDTFTSPIASASQQVDAVNRQIAAAQAGSRLTNLGAELHAATWTEPPENRAGAHLRVAYWLAAGSRVGGINGVLLATAQHAAAQARAELGGAGVIGSPFATEAGQVDRILYEGQRTAELQGRADVAAVLARLRTRAAVPTSSLEQLLGSPEARSRVAITALPVVAGIATLAWVMAPKLRAARMPEPRRRRYENEGSE
jgi:hypothetical protein